MTYSIKEQHGSILSSGKEIPYSLIRRKRRRTIEISISQSSGVRIVAPSFAESKEINDFVRQKANWIVRKVREMERESAYIENKAFRNGEMFLFLGRYCKLCINYENSSRGRIVFDGFKWIISLPSGLTEQDKEREAKKRLIEWYRIQAQEILGARVFYYARRIGIRPKTIKVKRQKSIWGSCNRRLGSINLNWKIIMSPFKVIDYIVVHELCHLKIANHSRKFWHEVEKIIPNFKEYHKWLKDHALHMRLP